MSASAATSFAATPDCFSELDASRLSHCVTNPHAGWVFCHQFPSAHTPIRYAAFRSSTSAVSTIAEQIHAQWIPLHPRSSIPIKRPQRQFQACRENTIGSQAGLLFEARPPLFEPLRNKSTLAMGPPASFGYQFKSVHNPDSIPAGNAYALCSLTAVPALDSDTSISCTAASTSSSLRQPVTIEAEVNDETQSPRPQSPARTLKRKLSSFDTKEEHS